MAEKLLELYKFATENGGLQAKIKLATATKIPSTMAAMAPDTPENVALFRNAIKEILGKEPPEL